MPPTETEIVATAQQFVRDHPDREWEDARVLAYHVEYLADALDAERALRRCNVPSPDGVERRLCDLWPGHDGPHVNAEGFEWRQQ